MKRIIAAPMLTVILAASIAFANPAAAQDFSQDENLTIPDDVQTAIVYGEDSAPPCPQGLICVVARMPEEDRFRIPSNLRDVGSPQNRSWTERVERVEMTSDFGTDSCSPTGVGGITGCTQEMISAAYRDRLETSDVRFGQLIEEARQERLSTIDVDAAAEQARVEMIEREYMERLEREREQPVGDEQGAEGSTLPPPPSGQ